MGTVRILATGELRHLDCATHIGRAEHSKLRSDNAATSRDHARISWFHGEWHLRDLGSVQGTFLDGERVAERTEHQLRPGQVVRIAGEDLVKIVSVEEPRPYARNIDTGEERGEADDGGIALPDGALLARDLDSPSGWVLLRDDTSTPWTGADPEWELQLPRLSEPTMEPGRSLANVHITFIVPKNLSRPMGLALRFGEEVVQLRPCQPFFPLYLLARARTERPDGFIERSVLQHQSGLSLKHLDAYLGRARERIVEALPDARAILELQRGWRRLRVRPDQLTFVPEP
jgi:hypothetical protein